jgi:hypothetical protein
MKMKIPFVATRAEEFPKPKKRKTRAEESRDPEIVGNLLFIRFIM